MSDGSVSIDAKIDMKSFQKDVKVVEKESQKAGEKVGEEAEKAAEKVEKESKKTGEKVGQDAAKTGEKVGKESKKTEEKVNKDQEGIGKKSEEESKKTEDSWKSAFGGIKSVTAATVTATAVAVTAVASAVAGVATMAVKNYAVQEQLVGGVETIFKDSADEVRSYADQAYKTAGVSANAYMQTVTGFSSSLLQGLGGDTAKAAEYANRAMIDMSDNANKFGTDIGSIQYAYQGFAKQNYTMLDNLRLGYGGTKEEMQRLIADSAALTDVQEELGITVDANDMSFGNIINAISVMQASMDIAGTTAKEASTTIQGSVDSMRAAWDNLVAGMADDNADLDVLIENFVDSFATMAENLLPRIEIAITGVGQVFEKLLPIIVSRLPEVINTVIPQMAQSAVNIVTSFATGIGQNLPQILQMGYDLVKNLMDGFSTGVPEVLPKILEFVNGIGQSIAEAAPGMVQKGFELLGQLVQGITEAIPILIEQVPQIISTFANIINENFPTILLKGGELLLQLVWGIIQAIPTLIANIPQIINAIVDALMAFNWLSLGAKIMNLLKNGVMSMIGALQSAGQSVFNAIKNAIKNLPNTLVNIGHNAMTGLGNAITGLIEWVKSGAAGIVTGIVDTVSSLPGKMLEVGTNLVKGLWNGISDMTGWILDKIRGFGDSVLSGIKDFFGIESPSKVMRDEVGQWLAKGVGVGFDKYNPMLQIERTLNVGMKGLESSLFGNSTTNHNQTNNFYGVQTPDQIARDLRLAQMYQ